MSVSASVCPCVSACVWQKYHQQRIKILGDCYYCVCGALPVRSDHAILAIHMGNSMVDAIR